MENAELETVRYKLQAAYLGLLKLSPGTRLEMQKELCFLRDAIAIDTGMTSKDVQDEFEFQVWSGGEMKKPEAIGSKS